MPIGNEFFRNTQNMKTEKENLGKQAPWVKIILSLLILLSLPAKIMHALFATRGWSRPVLP